ncbi:hypothetical protein [Flammeovirga sp. OC4]|uniref:hypothetical protein n=1 Tax=Flammeovirga sp. OC4 TaxID=1382345 RepID=UPI0005C56E26|nr:hypothetical protein [Flammeovirga sp. OC4]
MKTIVLQLIALFLISSCTTTKTALVVPPNSSIEIDYPNMDVFRASIKNGGDDVGIAVLSKSTEQQIRGFGLAPRANADVMVERENKLTVKNEMDHSVTIKLKVTKESRAVFEKQGEYVSFTLRNKSAQSIPLIIPTVMNPNLSPFSKSGVDLKMGQEILFRMKGRNYNLLTVDKSISNGDEIDVADLLKNRKRELNLD